jgi:hypothetical protein
MAAALMCSMSVFTSCSSDDDAPETTPTPQPVVLTGDAAVEWTRAHLDSLADVYLAR